MNIQSTIAKPALPHQTDALFLADGGLETVLIFHEDIDLPYFAAFTLLKTPEGREVLKRYYRRYIGIAIANKTDFILDSATWRANADWGDLLGYDAEELATANREAVELLHALRWQYASADSSFVINGCVGPRGDGYNPAFMMESTEAQAYHTLQIRAMAEAGADMISAITMTYPEEAIGIARAIDSVGLPSVVSFTVETDGRLPNGHDLGQAIAEVDEATCGGPAYYMINCAHPTHFRHALAEGEPWLSRIKGVRANASRMSHAELDESDVLDDGNPHELGQQFHELRHLLPALSVMGGCCGTDHRHIEAICHACQKVETA